MNRRQARLYALRAIWDDARAQLENNTDCWTIDPYTDNPLSDEALMKVKAEGRLLVAAAMRRIRALERKGAS